MWKLYDQGNTLGTKGSEQGIIVLDYEDDEIGRITLEKCRNYSAITYGVYGALVDTIYGNECDLRKIIEGLKIELCAFKYLTNSNECCELCENITERYNNASPVAKNKDETGFDDFRAFSINHFMIDMFPQIKNEFLEYTGADGYFFGAFVTFADILKPFILKELKADNKEVMVKFGNSLEDISYSEDEYILNFFNIGILEEIFFFDEDTKSKLFPYLLENTKKRYKEIEPYLMNFWYGTDENVAIDKLINDKCSKCGGQLVYRSEESTGMVYCIKCEHIEIVSTHFDSIIDDDKEYVITINPNNKIEKEKLRTITNLTGMNYLEIKDLLTNGGEVFRGRALDAKDYYIKLKINNIDFKIIPDYPLDYLLQKEGRK